MYYSRNGDVNICSVQVHLVTLNDFVTKKVPQLTTWRYKKFYLNKNHKKLIWNSKGWPNFILSNFMQISFCSIVSKRSVLPRFYGWTQKENGIALLSNLVQADWIGRNVHTAEWTGNVINPVKRIRWHPWLS